MSNYIPEEILVQILKCLPVETLVRFRCVCKGWKQLIDSPSLIQDHLALQKPRFIGVNRYYEKREFVVVDPQTQTQTQTLPSLETLRCPIEWSYLTGTLHGIVCLYESCTMRSGIFLWNPWTHKLLNVPVPEDMQYYRDDDPETSNIPSTYSAFWIDPFTRDFKIIVYKMVYTYREQWEKYGAIYSSSGDWKELSVGDIADYSLSGDGPAVVMGKVAYWRAFYWIQSHQVDDLSGFYRAVVISFDLEQERFDIIEGPSVLYTCPSCHPSLCNWQGSLSLVYLDLEKRCEIYSRQQDGSWLNLFRFNLTPNICDVFGILEERVLGEQVQENCKVLALTTEDELVTFDTRAGCCVHHLRSGDELLYYGFMAYDFVQSLLFP